MSFDKIMEVDFIVYSSAYSIKVNLPKVLDKCKLLSFDTETRSVYKKNVREESIKYLKSTHEKDELYRQAMIVSSSSGLSYPSIVKTTHFIFGESKSFSHVVICDSEEKEMLVWKMILKYEGLLLIHNSLFDLKIMYQRLGEFPKNYVDTSLLVKCLINHVNIWKAKSGLKELMGSYYDPKWVLMNDYEPENLKDPEFIKYCAIDGAATFYLWELIKQKLQNE